MKYELATLKDVFEKVPTDRIEDCMKELATGMAQAKAMRELLTIAGSEIAGKEVVCDMDWPESVTWMDDGAGKIDITYCGGEGDELLHHEIQMAGSNTEVSGAPRGELMNRELSARPLDRRVIRRSLTELLRLGPYVREGAETRATMEEAADEIERLREEIGRLLDSLEREGDRLDWLLSRLPGSVIRDLVGVMSNTRDAGVWRDLIDKAACFTPYNA